VDPLVVATYSFPNSDSYRISAPPFPSLLGGARAGSVRTDYASADFKVSVDLMDWDAYTNGQVAGVVARLSNIGFNSTDGYGFFYYSPSNGPAEGFIIHRIDDDVRTEIQLQSGLLDLDPTHDYRLVFQGFGSSLVGEVFDLVAPTTPLLTVTAFDSAYASGSPGVMVAAANAYSNSAAVATFDNFSVWTNPVSPDPGIVITNVSETVGFAISNIVLGGTSSNLFGDMTFTNALTGASSSFSPADNWTHGPVALAVGANLITVRGSNVFGAPASSAVTLTRGPAPGTVYTWTHTGNGSWTNPAYWTPTGYPDGAADTAVVIANRTLTIDTDTSITLGGFIFSNSASSCSINGGGDLTFASTGTAAEVEGGTLTVTCPLKATDTTVRVSSGALNLYGDTAFLGDFILTNSTLTSSQGANLGGVKKVDVYGDSKILLGYNNNLIATTRLFNTSLELGEGGNTPCTFSGPMIEQPGNTASVTRIHGYKQHAITASNHYSGGTTIRGVSSIGEGRLWTGFAAVWADANGVFGSGDVTLDGDKVALRLNSAYPDAISDTAALHINNVTETNTYIWLRAGVVEQVRALYTNGVRLADGYYGSVTAAVVHAGLNVNTNLGSIFPSYGSVAGVCTGLLHVVDSDRYSWEGDVSSDWPSGSQLAS